MIISYNELHNRNLHISGLLNEEKVDIEDEKVDIESGKEDIQDKKVDIESVLTGKVSNFSVKTTMICTLFTGQPVRRAFLCVIVMSLN